MLVTRARNVKEIKLSHEVFELNDSILKFIVAVFFASVFFRPNHKSLKLSGKADVKNKLISEISGQI